MVNCDTINIPFQQIYNTMKEIKNLGGLLNRNHVCLVIRDNRLEKLALLILESPTENILLQIREKICIDEIRNALFAGRIGENFLLNTPKFNLFEGLDFAITSALGENILGLHCDVMNDWQPGHNYCSVAKSIISDEENGRLLQVVFITYTRKDIGDYLYGASKFLSR